MTRHARNYITITIALGAMVMVIASAQGYEWVINHPVLFLGLVAGMILAERFVIHLTLSHETISFSVVELMMTVAVLSIDGGAFVLTVVLGMTGGQLIRRRPAVKAAFNVAMYAVGAGGAAAIFALMTSNGVAGPNGWYAAVGAMAAFYLINQWILATVVGAVEGKKVSAMLREGGTIQAAMWAGNVTFGLLVHRLATIEPVTAPLLLVPFGLSYAAYKAWVRSTRDSRKMLSLYDVGTNLIGELGSEHGLQHFLGATKQMFRASGALIVSLEGAQLRITRDQGDDEVVDAHPSAKDSRAVLEHYIQTNDWASCRWCSLVNEVGTFGALMIHDHKGPDGPDDFEPQDQHLLQMLSNQASVTIRNIALFDSVNHERGKLSDIVANTSDGIYQVGPDRRIMSWNPAMAAITGYSEAEAVGQMDFNVLHARDPQSNGPTDIGAGVVADMPQQVLAQIMTKDGSARWIDYTHSPIIDASGVVTSVVTVVRDITRQRAAQEAKEDFIATVSHELRTPLTPLKGFLITLMRKDVDISDSDKRSFYEMMYHQTERLERLVGDLLDASTLGQGVQDFETEPTNLLELAKKLVDTYAATNPAREIVLNTQLEHCHAEAHAARLEQVLGNLLENAIRYSEDGEPIDVTVGQRGTEVTIAVHDRGQGIGHNDQERVFERFFRSGSHLTRNQGGTGLGLYIAKSLVEGMGGRLSVVSRLGHGSTFIVHLNALTQVPDHTESSRP
ncbi:MAG: ATP-binding protein [Actinomycetota bacterium]